MKSTSIAIKISIIFLIIFSIISIVFASDVVNIWTTDIYGNLKTDFAPEQTVYISGSGFSPNSIVNIQITRPNGVVDVCPLAGRCGDLPVTDFSGSFSKYPYVLDGITGTYIVDANDGTKFAQTTFTDTPPVFFIKILNPNQGSTALNPVRVNGIWNVTNPPGQTAQENVRIEWGDGTFDDVININRTASDSSNNPHFISGTFDTQPIVGCTSSDNASDNCNNGNFNHSYSSQNICTNIIITAKLHHQQSPGHESIDSSASATIIPGVPENCANGKDDDCDNLIDCADPDCASYPSCAQCSSYTSQLNCNANSNCKWCDSCDNPFKNVNYPNGNCINLSADCQWDGCEKDCGAQCEANSDCPNQCQNLIWKNAGTCLGSCTCSYTNTNCDDGNVCTADSCNAQNGCQNTPIQGCCLTNSDCNDSNVCTDDSCVNNQCVHTNNNYQEQRACGSGDCTGTQTRICSGGSLGLWSDCSSKNNDCGVCAICDATGTCTYDSSQNGDCSQYNLPPLGTCTYNPDNIGSTWDYASGVQSVCAGLGQCSQPQYGQIFHTCDQNLAGSCTGWQCDDNTDCTQTTEMCDYTNRVYCTRDSQGTCNGNCSCVENSWTCTAPDDPEYCSHCSNHCGDSVVNCGEQCEIGQTSNRCIPNSVSTYYCINKTSYQYPDYNYCRNTCVWDNCETKKITENDTRCSLIPITCCCNFPILKETIIVPSTGTSPYNWNDSSTTLLAGKSYKIVASGIYYYKLPDMSYVNDATYGTNTSAYQGWKYNGNLKWKQLDGIGNINSLFSSTTLYTPKHSYATVLTGKGYKISFSTYDNNRNDNRGEIIVSIYECGSFSPPLLRTTFISSFS